ncbi:OmpA family protein, partial [bacterium]|nr:OmpA family protein [bacterium]
MHGWTGLVPFGLGVQYYLNEKWSLDFSAGDNYTFSDELNPLNGDEDDSFLSGTVGLRYVVLEANKDKDGDGLLNKEEKLLGTDPKNPDTDGDGLLDGDELNNYRTDPLLADSDGDQLADGEEVNTTKTDPNNPDSDADGLNDYDELNTYMTDPLVVDSDGDMLSDYDEVMTHATDPNNRDTDGDKLTDGDEVTKIGSSPVMIDTDEGGIGDYEEVMRGTNPNDAVDDLAAEDMIIVDKGKSIVLAGILFASGKADIVSASEPILKKAKNTMIAYPMMTVSIEGHTDNTGSLALNTKLSQLRAEAVVNWLIDNGIDAGRLE